ncbi:hypothetical protein JCGZ_18390 [Jatropha curcas]|uniref:Uncharacterized protein n=1 Tax=Jatropha curcas TaxID=180498 RepID=A0A067KCV2_JATCU|nr:hypothetical protein JCGZ_18390 [Jatropha curcas]
MPPGSSTRELSPFYLYYGMNLCVRGVHLKVGYKQAIEACENKVLPMSGLFGFEGGVNARTLP